MNSKALNYGIIGGIISIGISLVIYLINPALLAKFWIAFAILPIVIIIDVMGTIAARKNMGGYMTFGQAFLNSWLIGVIMSVISVIFSILLYQVIDPELPAFLTEETLKNTAEFMESMGMPDEAIEEGMKQAASQAETGFTVGGQLQGLIGPVIFWAFIALIIGLIVKRNPPEGEPMLDSAD